MLLGSPMVPDGCRMAGFRLMLGRCFTCVPSQVADIIDFVPGWVLACLMRYDGHVQSMANIFSYQDDSFLDEYTSAMTVGYC